MKTVLFWACLAVLPAAAQSISFTFDALKPDVLQQRMRLAHPKNPERYARLKQLFEESGCNGAALQEQAVKGSKEPNLICTIPGTGPDRILIGAHFDAVGGDGVIDNWSGAVMLPSLYQTLKAKPHKHTLVFVGFAGEEKGLLGSRAYLKSLSKEDQEHVSAMIGLDSLGLGPTKCWLHGSDDQLAARAHMVAQAMKLDFGIMNVEQVGTTDSQVFRDKGIRVLSLHSITPETWKLINSKRDVWSILSWQDYYESYRLVSAIVTLLDQI